MSDNGTHQRKPLKTTEATKVLSSDPLRSLLILQAQGGDVLWACGSSSDADLGFLLAAGATAAFGYGECPRGDLFCKALSAASVIVTYVESGL